MGIGFIQKRAESLVDWRRCPHPRLEELPSMDRNGNRLRCVRCAHHLQGTFQVYDDVTKELEEEIIRELLAALDLALEGDVWEPHQDDPMWRRGFETATNMLRVQLWFEKKSEHKSRGKHAAESRA